MQTKFPLSKVMLYQGVGFLAVIALSWFVELTGLRGLVLGGHPYISDFRESALEMLLVLGVWLLVATSTRRILTHARYLEGFMRVCSWCHHIDYKDEWIPAGGVLRKGFDTRRRTALPEVLGATNGRDSRNPRAATDTAGPGPRLAAAGMAAGSRPNGSTPL